jgi:hypothetical protein
MGVKAPARTARPAVKAPAAPVRRTATPAPTTAGLQSVQEVLSSPGVPLDITARRHMEDRFAGHLDAIGHRPVAGESRAAEAEADRVADRVARSERGSSADPLRAVDFRHVRLHTGPAAAASAQLIGARAYASGSHVVVDDGRVDVGSRDGRHIIAHELTHVIQRVGARPFGSLPGAPIAGTEAQVARKEDYPNVHAEVLKGMIAIVKKHKADGPDRIGDLQALARTVPEKDRPGLLARLEKPPRHDQFTDFVRNTFPVTREAFFVALGKPAKATAAPAPAPDPAAAPSQPAKGFAALNKAKANPKYIDNDIERIRSDGETAEIYYKGQTKPLIIGLVPENIKAPFEAVDYRSGTGSHGTLDPTTPDTIRFVPHAREIGVPKGATVEEAQKVWEKRAREIRFVVEPESGRLVPTEVNSLTAPLLCKTLVKADEENEALAQATSTGGVKVFKAFGLVLEIASFLSPAKAARMSQIAKGTPQGTLGMIGVFRSMRQRLTALLGEAAKKGTAIEGLTVEGVTLGAVKPVVQGSTFTVRYAFIINTGRQAGHGRMAQWALEVAAKDVAKAQGAKVAQVIVEGPIQAKWLAYLESIGYRWSAAEMPAGMLKVIPL